MTSLRLPDLNLVVVAGRLTRDPDVRSAPSGTAVCNFTLAVSRRYKNRQGEWVDEPTFINAVAWGEMAERCRDRLKKGSPVLLNGSLRSREWETKEGQKRKEIEIFVNRIQFLEKSAKADAEDQDAIELPDSEKETLSADEVPF